MQSTALTTFLQDSKTSNLNIQTAVCGQLNNILFDSSLVINGRRPSFMGIEKSNGTMVVISNWLSHPNLSPTDGWCLARAKILCKDLQTPAFDVFSAGADREERCWLSLVQVLDTRRAGHRRAVSLICRFSIWVSLQPPASCRVLHAVLSLRVCRLHLDCIISCQHW